MTVCVLNAAAGHAAVVPAISVSPSTVSLRPGDKQTFTATLTGLTPAPAIDWLVISAGVTTPLASTGALATVYTAPASVPTTNTVTVEAVDHANAAILGKATVTLLNPIPAITSLSPSSVNTGLAYSIALKGTGFLASSQVLFDGKAATGAKFVSATEIDLTGTSTLTAGTKIAVAVVNPDPGTKTSGTATLTVVAPVAITVTPDKQTIRIGAAETFAAHLTNTADNVVTWQVNGKDGGDAATGTIDSKGIYTPPSVLPTTPAVTIKAISHADPTKNASVTLNLDNAVPTLTSVAPTALTTGSATLTVNGTGFAPGAAIWFEGAAVTTKFVSNKQLTAALTVSLPVGGIAAVKVVNPNPGSATSGVATVPITVSNAKMTYLSAVRLLEQATFGPTPASIQHLQEIGRDAWLAEQFATPASAWPDPLPNEGIGRLQDTFFTVGMTGNDQLRQRVALALAEITVVSGLKDTQFSQMVGYQKLLADSAFGSYRDLLGKITLSPSMGVYLDMVNNAKANPAKGTAANENYARESMQLFSLGLAQLNSDGTPIAPGNLPEYDQATVTDLAKVFTGWTFAPEPGFAGTWPNPEYDFAPMVAVESYHDETQKTLNLPIPCTIPAGGQALSDLNEALDCIYKQQNVAPFISYRLIQRLVESSPSPAYVARVAAVFKATGGNLQAVVTAILTDTEAAAEGTGKMREPILQTTTLLRELNAKINVTATGLSGQSAAMGQTALDPSSVFSYFSPSFRVNGVVAPEFQSLNAETEFGRVNYAYRAANNAISGNVIVDLTNWQDLASDPAQLVAAIDQALYRGEMTSAEKTAITAAAALSKTPITSVRDALYVAAAAPQYQIEK
jgi:uncharacterized protein (DUF1800 family)